jgi:probable F420-dependent oxidoreductase
VQIDAIVAVPLAETAAAVARAERLGCDGIMVPEVAHDPFLPLAIAAGATQRLRLATGIAVAFARNPMNVAVLASDLHRASGGRFALGLGSQIKPHVTRRFSMPWSHPAARMREYVAAVRAIWHAWETQTPLRFEGEHYAHTLMTPMFDHGPSPCGWPTVHVAAVGPVMTGVAGEVADGLNTHGFTTADYLRDVTLPHLASGLARAGRARGDVEVSVPVMTAFVDDPDDPRLDATRAAIAFYGSTPAYRGVLDHHGWGALGDELHALSRRGDWAAMGGLVDDDVLHAIAIVGDPAHVGAEIARRYGGIVDRIQLGLGGDEDDLAAVIDALGAATRA